MSPGIFHQGGARLLKLNEGGAGLLKEVHAVSSQLFTVWLMSPSVYGGGAKSFSVMAMSAPTFKL